MKTREDLDNLNNIEVTLKSLKANHFGARFAQTASEAKEMILEMIPLTACIGVGDSTTLRQLGIIKELVGRGNKVINPFTRELTQRMKEDPAILKIFRQAQRRTFGADVFLTSANALTEDGKIVSIDRVGNRVAGTIFAAEKVILPIGRNKIVQNVDDALFRIKNVIAPAHARRKERKTPCAVTGKCDDCNSPDRICNVTVILEKKPLHTDLSVILINEDMGLGWNSAWDEKRINKIRSDYYQNTWLFSTQKSK
ncbi:lactate utilization protein [Thermodesulfobacteriota bacterium]